MAKIKGEPVPHGQIAAKTTTPTSPRTPVAQTRGKTQHPATPSSQRKPSPHRATSQGQQRGDRPPDPSGAAAYGPPTIFPEHALRYPPRFRFAVAKANGDVVALSHVTAAAWDDVNAILTGSITFTEPVFHRADPYKLVDQGDRISCLVDVHDGQSFRELWQMRAKTPQLGVNEHSRTFDLTNDLALALASEGNFLYNPDASHPGGWYGHDIIIDVCRRFRIPVGAVYKSDWRIPKLWVKRGSPLTVIRNVLLKELRHSRRRMVVRFEGGRLYVLPLQRSLLLRALGPTLLDAAFKSELRPEFATAVLMHGLAEFTTRPDQIKNHSKMHTLRVSEKSIEKFGYVQKILWSPDALNDDQLRREADTFLAEVAKPHKTLTLTAPGMPRLRRGDAIKLGIGDDALRRQIVWVDEVSHALSPQQYVSTVTCIFDDPFVPHNELRRIFKLKATREEAVGNRAKKDPAGWYLTKGQKSDQSFQQSRQAAIFNAAASAEASVPADDPTSGAFTTTGKPLP